MKRTRFAGAGLLLLGGGLWGFGRVAAPVQACQSYLFGLVCCFTLVIGALFLLLIGYAANVTWFVPIRRPCEAIVSALPALGLLFVPVLLTLRQVYPWARPEALPEAARELVRKKAALLNPTAFVLRALLFLAILIAVGELLRAWSLRQERAPERYRRRLVALGAGGIPLVALVFTLCAFDFCMSLEPTFYSDIYGVYLFAGGFLAALGLLGMLVVLGVRAGRLPAGVGPGHYTALGRLELAMVIFWTYIGYAQLMIVWVADLPLETSFYRTRWSGGWQWVGLTLLIVHWAVPFFLLLSRPLKRDARSFFAISCWLVLVHVLDVFYLIVPAFHPHAVHLHWLDVAALAAVLGACLLLAALRSGRAAPVPRSDPLYELGLGYEQS